MHVSLFEYLMLVNQPSSFCETWPFPCWLMCRNLL